MFTTITLYHYYQVEAYPRNNSTIKAAAQAIPATVKRLFLLNARISATVNPTIDDTT
jgi:hypothetical protein